MIKKVLKVVLSFVLSLGMVISSLSVTWAANDDFTTIKSRLKEFMISQNTFDDGAKVETCYVTKAKDYLDMIQEDGSFADVDYTMTGSAANGGAWEPYLALDRLQAIAIAYHVKGNPLQGDKEVIEKLNLAIAHWTKANNGSEPTNTNWWERQIGIQLRFSRIALMMDGVEGIAEDTMNTLLYKLLEKTPEKYGTGQNNLWFDQNYVYYAIITENGTKYKDSLKDRHMIDLKELVDNYLSYCLVVQEDDNTAEAVQVDNSFYMHGRQFYSNGYGLSMFRDMSYWLYMLNDTAYEFDQDIVDLMADYMLDGTSWTIRDDIMELYLGYRPYDLAIGYKNYASAYILPLERMIAVDHERADEYQAILDNITDETTTNGKNGNYYMWRSAYASHMRDNYGVNIKMDSNQVIGGEWRGSWTGQEDGGQLIYWTSSASSYITVDGGEYNNVYPTYDWAHVPGTTTAARVVEDYSNYGRFTNGTEHTIGVSNGKYGATAYDMNKKGTQVKKGYFFFDDEFVALGAGINSTEKVNIHTTLNQSEAKNVNVGGTVVPDGTVNETYNTKWLYNDDIGYVFLEDTDVVVSNAKQDNPSLWTEEAKKGVAPAFKAYINHGLNPDNDTYAYIVVPDKSANEVKNYAEGEIPVEILSNTSEIQAVRHNGLKVTQINFYKAGSLDLKNSMTITVDKPCSIIVDESSDVRKISLAVSDTKANETVNVQMKDDNHESQTTFVSSGLPYAGQTMTMNEGADNHYQTSSQVEDHGIEKVFDNDEATYWQSESQQDQWVSFFTENNKHLSTLNILWDENYANDYDIYVSDNGQKYELLKSVTNGDGGEDIIDLNGVYPYIMIKFGNGAGSNYQIKEMTWKASESLALNKEVEVSSTSTNDPGNTKEKAVDGNTSTRWSSLRNEDDNWIIVDLGHYAQIDAMSIQWESACSDDYDIQVSSNKVNWTTIEDGKKTSSEYLDSYSYDEPVYGRYVKVHSHKSTQLKYGISIYELSVYGRFVDEDIASNKNAFSSTIKDLNLPTNAVDHKSNTSWISEKSGEQWIYVELKGIYEISHMDIEWGTNYASQYEIQISDDAQNWTTIKTVKGQGNIETINDLGNQQAKYVRLKLNESSGDNYQIVQWSIYGNLIEADSQENIAFNKEASASSVHNNVYDASRAFDGSFENNGGNNQSRWVSKRESNDEYIQVDLNGVYDLSGAKLYWEGSGAKKYEIVVSMDGEEWTQVYLQENGQPGIDEITFDQEVQARYVRMHGIDISNNKYGYSLWEFEVYGKFNHDIDEPEPKVNVALNKDSKASSEFIDTKDGNKQYYSSLAFDGSTDSIDGKQSRWVSLRTKETPDAENEWIYVDLGANYDISKVVLNWEGAGAKEYKIQVSDDAKEWKDITHITDGNGGIDEFDYDNVTGRYVKMQGLEPGGVYGFSLWEFEVYGEAILDVEGPNENISFNKEAQSSYEYKTHKTSLAFDGLGIGQNAADGTASRWVSLRKKDADGQDYNNQWIYVDLGGIYEINKVVLMWEGAGASEYKVQVSDDAKTWTDVAHIKDTDDGVAMLSVDETKEGNNRIQTLTFDTVQARYVKMQGITPASEYGYSLWEFEVYNTTDLDLLVEAYDQYKDFDVSSYTPASVAQFTEALNALVTLSNDKTTTKEDILKAIENLETTVSSLTKLADKTELSTAIDNASQSLDTVKYTPNSITKVTEALEKARKVFSNDNATQDEVDEAIETLNHAVEGLVEKAHKDNLTSIFNEAYQLDKEQYTTESYAKVEALLLQVEAIIDDENVSQKDVDQMYEQLRQALDALVVIPSEEEKPGEEPKPEEKPEEETKPEDTTKPEQKPDSDIEITVQPDQKPQEVEKPVGQVANTTETVTQTGDTTSLLPMMILLMVSGAGYYVIKKSSLFKK